MDPPKEDAGRASTAAASSASAIYGASLNSLDPSTGLLASEASAPLPLDGINDSMSSFSDDGSYSSDAEGFQYPRQQMKRKRQEARRSSVSSDNTVRSAPIPRVCSTLTVLFRLVGKDRKVTDFKLSSLEMFFESEAPGEVREMRINRAKNLIAVDVKSIGGVNKLVSLKCVCSVPVSAFLPAAKTACIGSIRVPDTSLDDAQLALKIRAPVPVTSVHRLGANSETVKIVFSAASLPKWVHVGIAKFPVFVFKPKPTQCFNCGRFGHVGASCKRDQQCLKCSGKHDTSACADDSVQKCINCGKAHSARDHICAVKQLETAAHRYARKEKIATTQARKILRQRNTASREKDSSTASQHGTTAPPTKPAVPPAGYEQPCKTPALPRISGTVTGATFAGALKGSNPPPPAPSATRADTSASQESTPAAPSLPKRNEPQNLLERPFVAHELPTSFSSPASTFKTFLNIAFMVLKSLVQCSWLPQGVRTVLELVLPLEASISALFQA